MNNSAREILNVIQGWKQVSSSTAEGQRGLKQKNHVDQHVDVMLYLYHVRDFLRTLDRLGRHTSSYWPVWYSLVRTIAVYPNSWGSSGSGAFKESDLNTLDRLAQEMDDLKYSTNEDLYAHLTAIDDWLCEVESMASEDGDLPEALRESIQALVSRLRAALDGRGDLDATQFMDLFRDLWREVGHAEEEKTSMRQRWARTRSHGTAFVGNVLANIAANGAITGTLMLTAG